MLRLLIAVPLLLPAAAAAAGPRTVKIVSPNGQPAAGATVWVYQRADDHDATPEPKPLTADAAGEVPLPPYPKGKNYWLVFARDAAGRVGYSGVQENRPKADDGVVRLMGLMPLAGRLTSADGKPVAGANISPQYYAVPGPDLDGSYAAYIELPPWERPRHAVTSDADGRFALPTPPGGYGMTYQVEAAGYGKTTWTTTAGAEPLPALTAASGITFVVEGIDPKELKGVDYTLSAKAEAAGPGTHRDRRRFGDIKPVGRQTVPDVPPGEHTFYWFESGKLPAVLTRPAGVTVVAGQDAVVTLQFRPAATVTGRVLDPAGKGVPDAMVTVSLREGTSLISAQLFTVTTDAAGRYTAYGPAGWYEAFVKGTPPAFALPDDGSRRENRPPVKAAAGESTELLPVQLLAAVQFVGVVRGEDGKPAADVPIVLERRHQYAGTPSPRTDAQGRFTVGGLAPDDAVDPRVRVGGAVNVPRAYEMSKYGGPVTIEVSQENATAFTGRVLGADGKPVAGAQVFLSHTVWGVGRNARLGTPRTVEGKTDAAGRYHFTGLWPGDSTKVKISAPRYAPAETTQATGVAGKTHDFGDTRLARDGLTVRGVVRNADGSPAAGAEVFGVGGTAKVTTTAAADGSFALAKMPEGGGFVLAKAPGTKLAFVPVTGSDGKPVTLTLAKADGVPVPPPTPSPQHKAATEALAKQVLTRLWEGRGTRGWSFEAVEGMAKLDPVTARLWAEEEKAKSGGKTDYTATVEADARADKRLADAKADPDEAVATVARMRGTAGYTEAVRLARAVLPTDKATALRFAEEAVVRARTLPLPARLYSLARAGDLALLAGGAGGRKVIEEAAAAADKLAPNGNVHDTMAVGLTAAYLAPLDWPKAEAMLNSLKTPHEYNRHLADCVAKVARTDPAAARALFDRFKPAGDSYPETARIRYAEAIAADRPDEAVAAVGEIEGPRFRVEGYVRLATRFARTDKARAVRLIDLAFEVMEREVKTYHMFGGTGGVAGLAAVATYRAKAIGHPDVPQLVARTVALQNEYLEHHMPGELSGEVAKVAAALALTDPATARHLLATAARPEEFLSRPSVGQRDWLAAVALTDPAGLSAAVVGKIGPFGDGRTPYGNASEQDFVALMLLLTAGDRLSGLTREVMLPRLQEGDDE